MRAEPLHQTRPADADVTEAIGRDAILAIVEDAGATCGGIRLARIVKPLSLSSTPDAPNAKQGVLSATRRPRHPSDPCLLRSCKF